MRKMTKKNRVLAAAGALALVVGGGGAAYAYWTTTGEGSGTATNSEGKGEVVLTAHFADGLAPGNSTGVVYKANNSTTSSTRVGVLSANVTTSDPDNCLASWFGVTAVTSNSLVAANSTGTPVGSGTLTFNDSADNQDLCKSAVITVNVISE
jgi:hypothetical protein